MKQKPVQGGADKDIWYRTSKVHNKVYNQKSNHQMLGNLRTGKGTDKVQLVPKSGKNTKYTYDVETYAQRDARRRKEKEGVPSRPSPSSQNKGTSATLARADSKRTKEILKRSTDGIVNKTAGAFINGVNAGGDAFISGSKAVGRGVKKIFDSKGPPAGSFLSSKPAPKKSGGKKATPKKDPPKRLPTPKGPKAKPAAKPAAKRISRGY